MKITRQIHHIALLLLCAAVAPTAYAHGDGIEPRIGLKSEAVIRNDLRLLGIDTKVVSLSGNWANANIMYQGKPATLQIDRTTGGIMIKQAPKATQELLKQRIPKIQLLENKPIIAKPIRLDPGVKTVTPVKPTIQPMKRIDK